MGTPRGPVKHRDAMADILRHQGSNEVGVWADASKTARSLASIVLRQRGWAATERLGRIAFWRKPARRDRCVNRAPLVGLYRSMSPQKPIGIIIYVRTDVPGPDGQSRTAHAAMRNA